MDLRYFEFKEKQKAREINKEQRIKELEKRLELKEKQLEEKEQILIKREEDLTIQQEKLTKQKNDLVVQVEYGRKALEAARLKDIEVSNRLIATTMQRFERDYIKRQ